LQAPVLGCINVHASLLPRWRGAAPIQRAILAGDSERGVSIMQVVQRLDSGDVLLQRRCPIGARTTGGELHDRLARMGGDALIEAINALEMGSIAPRAQDEAAATYAKKLDKAEARLGWRESAPALARAVRAFNPWPVAHTRLAGKTVRVWMAEALDEPSPGAPGSVIRASARGVDVATGQGVLRIEALQWSGGRVLEAREAVNGFVFQGQRFD
jgi:methionyl-tRNA formyltransferase